MNGLPFDLFLEKSNKKDYLECIPTKPFLTVATCQPNRAR